MEREPLDTEKFVAKVFTMALVTNVIDEYRVAPEKLQQIIVSTMRDVGIFVVHPQHQSYFHRFIVNRLRNDPEILRLAQMARMREATRTRSRHSE